VPGDPRCVSAFVMVACPHSFHPTHPELSERVPTAPLVGGPELVPWLLVPWSLVSGLVLWSLIPGSVPGDPSRKAHDSGCPVGDVGKITAAAAESNAAICGAAYCGAERQSSKKGRFGSSNEDACARGIPTRGKDSAYRSVK
jgi:hypothetical protein